MIRLTGQSLVPLQTIAMLLAIVGSFACGRSTTGSEQAPAPSTTDAADTAAGHASAITPTKLAPQPPTSSESTEPASSTTGAPAQPATDMPNTSGTDAAMAGASAAMERDDPNGMPGAEPATEPEMEPTIGGAGNAMEPGVDLSELDKFSFFVTSLEIMRELSGSADGFGGDLGGLNGADGICQEAAARVGFGAKAWRAFLSVTDGGDGRPIHAIDRIGEGPWYDRNGRLVAENIAGLLSERPMGDPQTVNDLPNEFGEGLKQYGDTHDILTGTNAMGQLDSTDPANTCNDWTSTTAQPGGTTTGSTTDEEPVAGLPGGGSGGGGGGGFPGGGPGGGPRGGPGGAFINGIRIGHAWPAQSGAHWIASHAAGSCAPGVNLVQNGPGDESSVGAGGGWGAFYCFALTP